MLRAASLLMHPAACRALTGLTVPEFEQLDREVQPRLATADRVRRSRPNRRRAIGGGHPFALPPPDQLLLTVIWLRRYLTHQLLGLLFGVDEATVRRTVRRVLPVLETLGRDTIRLPDPKHGKRPTLAALLAETPDLAVIIDTFEQRIQRPTERTEADAYYSGKKKQHTLKSQVAVDERDGRITDVAESVRGPTNDLRLLKTSGLLARLPPKLGALGDLAYVGIGALHPTGLAATPRRKPRGQPRPPEDIAFNTAFAQRRVTVEHSIRRLRIYEAITAPDRHHRRQHTARVVAIAGLVNRQLAARKTAADQETPMD